MKKTENEIWRLFIPLSPPLGLLRATGLVGQAAVLEAEDFCVVGLDLAELVHELELVDADVAGAVPGRQVLAVGADADAADLEKQNKCYFGLSKMITKQLIY